MSEFTEKLSDFFYSPEEDVGGLFKPEVDPAQSPVLDADQVAAEYLAFVLQGECYAIPISEIREIVRVPPLTEMPRSPKNLLGVMKIRGEVLPVYDIKVKLKLADIPVRIAGPEGQSEALPASSRVLIVRDREGDVGVVVDEVRDVIRLKPSDVEPLAPGIGGGDYLLGLAHPGQELVILLDIHKALP